MNRKRNKKNFTWRKKNANEQNIWTKKKLIYFWRLKNIYVYKQKKKKQEYGLKQ